jgi:hypothetical protein
MAAKDLSGINSVVFDLRASRTGSNLKFGLHNKTTSIFTQDWATQPYGTTNTTVNSSGGILNVTSTSGDPTIDMTGLGSFDPNTYKFINIRYRVVSGTAGNTNIFFYNSRRTTANEDQTVVCAIISDGLWHIQSIDMSVHQYWTNSNVTGWRYDWCNTNAVNMEFDYIRLSSTAQPELEDLEIAPNIIAANTAQSVKLNIANVVPTMTSNTVPFGVASASTIYSATFDAWKAFDKIHTDGNDNCWHSQEAVAYPHWLQYQFSTAKTITSYTIVARTTYDVAPSTWTFLGSNTGAFAGEETVLDTQTGLDIAMGEIRIFSFVNTTAYTYYRINMTSGAQAANCGIAELELSDISINTHKNAIDKHTITVINADAANTFYVDNFGSIKEDVFGFLDHEIFPVIDVFGTS